MMTAARKHVEVINRLYEEIIKRGDCISIKDLDISGSDLMELGMSGPRIGETLNSMLHIVMENPKLNDKETLIAMLGTLEQADIGIKEDLGGKLAAVTAVRV